jgi:hypothetical protein
MSKSSDGQSTPIGAPITSAEMSNPTVAAHLQQPRTTVAAQLGLSDLDSAERESAWAAVGIDATLEKMARLHADIDFATLDGTRKAVELRWLMGVEGDAARRAASLVNQGSSCFSARGLIQCGKEVIEFGDEASDVVISDSDFLHLLAAIHGEHDRPRRLSGLPDVNDVDPASLQRVMDFFEERGQDFIDAERGEFMVDEVATASFERSESLIASLALTHDTWRRPWPASPPAPVLGNSPAETFTAALRSVHPEPSIRRIVYPANVWPSANGMRGFYKSAPRTRAVAPHLSSCNARRRAMKASRA